MNAKISFHNVDHSDALQHFVQDKSAKLFKILRNGENLSWVVDRDAESFQPVLKLKLKNGDRAIKAKSHNAFKAVNIVFDKAKRIINSAHQKRPL